MKVRWPHRNHDGAIRDRQSVLRSLPQWQPEDERIFDWAVEPERLQGFQECLTGQMVLPVGVVGPLSLDLGRYRFDSDGGVLEEGRSRDQVFVPLAHTEGGLSASVHRGFHVLNLAGGVRTDVLQDQMTRDSVFVFATAEEAVVFRQWILAHEAELLAWMADPEHPGKVPRNGQRVADISSHAVLRRIHPRIVGPACHLLYRFTTGEACGPNMITRNAFAMNQEIARRIQSRNLYPRHVFLEANLGGDKKPSHEYYSGGHGKTVIASAVIPTRVVSRYLNSSPEALETLEWAGMHGANASGMQSFAFTPASAVAAIFAATGQDLGMVGTSSMAHGTVRRTPEGVSFTLQFGGIEVGTVGGGTALPHARSYLRMMGCEGPGSAQRLAQVIAATALALEISAAAAMASQASENFFRAHLERGGNR